MKRLLSRTILTFAILSVLNGCSGTQPSEKPVVDSGTVDENYVGDANATVKEDYKQTTDEAQIQAGILKKIEEKKASEMDGEDLGGHF